MKLIQTFIILLIVQISYGISFPLVKPPSSIYDVNLFNITAQYDVDISKSKKVLQAELINDQQDYIVTALGNKHNGHQYDSDYRVKQVIYNNYLLLFSKKIYL